MILPFSFYLQEDVVSAAKNLIGKALYTRFEGILTGGIITETEAYNGMIDKASHAYLGRRTKRNEAMYLQGGIAYIYLCYGLHYLLNVVTNTIDVPHAILIRAIHPTHGVEEMLKRRKKTTLDRTLTNGPGSLTQALGINLTSNGKSLSGSDLWIEEGPQKISEEKIIVSPRIGVEYAKEDALLPYRFFTHLAK